MGIQPQQECTPTRTHDAMHPNLSKKKRNITPGAGKRKTGNSAVFPFPFSCFLLLLPSATDPERVLAPSSKEPDCPSLLFFLVSKEGDIKSVCWRNKNSTAVVQAGVERVKNKKLRIPQGSEPRIQKSKVIPNRSSWGNFLFARFKVHYSIAIIQYSIKHLSQLLRR